MGGRDMVTISSRWVTRIIEMKFFDYIDREDSPRPVTFQLDLLRSVGFTSVDVLHKNSAFAAFGAVKPKRDS